MHWWQVAPARTIASSEAASPSARLRWRRSTRTETRSWRRARQRQLQHVGPAFVAPRNIAPGASASRKARKAGRRERSHVLNPPRPPWNNLLAFYERFEVVETSLETLGIHALNDERIGELA
jgi:hypothetical protein